MYAVCLKMSFYNYDNIVLATSKSINHEIYVRVGVLFFSEPFSHTGECASTERTMFFIGRREWWRHRRIIARCAVQYHWLLHEYSDQRAISACARCILRARRWRNAPVLVQDRTVRTLAAGHARLSQAVVVRRPERAGGRARGTARLKCCPRRTRLRYVKETRREKERKDAHVSGGVRISSTKQPNNYETTFSFTPIDERNSKFPYKTLPLQRLNISFWTKTSLFERTTVRFKVERFISKNVLPVRFSFFKWC